MDEVAVEKLTNLGSLNEYENMQLNIRSIEIIEHHLDFFLKEK